MQYRAVGNRCAVVLESLRLPISDDEALAILLRKGFRLIATDPIALARSRIGVSCYRRRAQSNEAPGTVDCSTFTKWVYGRQGIWLPRRTIQQRSAGIPVEFCDVIAGDLVFTLGHINWYEDDPRDAVGHVGIAMGEGTVVHAAHGRIGVVETPLQEFVSRHTFRGVRTYIPRDEKVLTLETPAGRLIECSDDFRWIVLSSCGAALKKTKRKRKVHTRSKAL